MSFGAPCKILSICPNENRKNNNNNQKKTSKEINQSMLFER